MYNGLPGYDMVDGKLVIKEAEAAKIRQAYEKVTESANTPQEATPFMEYEMAERLAQSIQPHMSWDQSEEKRKEIAGFILANADEKLDMEKNIVRIIDLYQKNNHKDAVRIGMLHTQTI